MSKLVDLILGLVSIPSSLLTSSALNRIKVYNNDNQERHLGEEIVLGCPNEPPPPYHI